MKRIMSLIFVIFMVAVCSIAGGVLLSGCGSKGGEDTNIETSATVPSRIIFQTDLNGGGTMTLPRAQQIYSMSLTFYGYGFATNSRGWFESQNKGVNSSYSMMRISFSANSGASFTIRYRSYGESNYDYAIFGNLDQTLSEDYTADSTYYKRTYGESSPNDYYVTYSGISSGSHYIYVKYRKDGSQHSNDDTLQLFFESDGQYTNSYTSHWQYVGLMIGQLPTATRSGYVFDGWWTAKSGGTRVTETTIYTGVATSGYQCLILFAHWTTTSTTYPISFDYGQSGVNVNLYNPSMMYAEGNLTQSSGRWTSNTVSGNLYGNLKIQLYENGSYVSESNRTTVGLLTHTITKTVTNAYLRMGFNGSTVDACLHIDLSSLQNGTYTISADLLVFPGRSAEGGTFGNIKIEKGSTYTGYTEMAKDVRAGTTYGTLPTPTKTGYTFSSWYRKKNYLNMDAMIDYLNKYQSDSSLKFQKDSDGTYSWCGGSADTGDGVQYRIFPVSLTVGGVYRLSYLARGSVTGELYSTSLAPRRLDNSDWYGNAFNDCYVIRDTTWRWYETSFTVGSDFGGFSCGDWYGYERTYFKNIRLERIDIEDAETTISSSSYQSFMAGHTLYARWSTNSYTVAFSANGGSGSMSSRTFTYDTWYSVSNSFSRAGYTFAGWTMSNATSDTHYYGSSTSSYSTTSSTAWTHGITGTAYYKNLRSTSGTVTLTAQWTANTYTVTFNPNGGTIPAASSGCIGGDCGCSTPGVCICKGCEVDNLCICCKGNSRPGATKSVIFNSPYGTLPTPTMTDWSFAGWWTDPSGGTQITSSTTYTTVGNQTLYAHWTPNVASVTVVLRMINKDGTGGTTDTNAGGQVSISFTEVTGSTTKTSSVTQTTATATYSAHAGKNFVLNAMANPGYVLAGFSTYSTPPAAITNPTSPRDASQTYAPAKGSATYYVYFKQLSGNQLKYDETGKYFYFEDGYYPQSRAAN